MSENEIQGVKTAALLHDIGKLAVPEHILSKPGPLTPEEFQKIRAHPKVGADIVSSVPFPYPVAPLILSHHERWDGKGYPAGPEGRRDPARRAHPLGRRLLRRADGGAAVPQGDDVGGGDRRCSSRKRARGSTRRCRACSTSCCPACRPKRCSSIRTVRRPAPEDGSRRSGSRRPGWRRSRRRRTSSRTSRSRTARSTRSTRSRRRWAPASACRTRWRSSRPS